MTTSITTTTVVPITTTTIAPTTTDGLDANGVPVKVQDAYRVAGQPPLSAEDYEQFSDTCNRLATDETYQSVFAQRDADERTQIVENLLPLCPDIRAIVADL